MSGGLRLAALAMALLLGAPAGVGAQVPASGSLPPALQGGPRRAVEGVPLRVSVHPSPAAIGARLAYRGAAVVDRRVRVDVVRPRSGGAFTWSEARIRRVPFAQQGSSQWGLRDSVVFEATLQVFDTGLVAVPGPEVRFQGVSWSTRALRTRLPTAHVLIQSTLNAADTAARFRPLRGPLAAPWWERISWSRVAAGVLALAALLLFVRMLRRRKPAAAPVRPVAAAPRPRRDAAGEALAALAALRREQLPEHGRFDQHAFELTRILRRYLEATFVAPRPGDTSPELIERMRQSRHAEEQLTRLAGLLGVWDRLKFARASSSVSESRASESAVEDLIERTRGAGRVT